MKFTLTLGLWAFLFMTFSVGQSGNSCSDARSVTMSEQWTTLQGGSQSTAYYSFTASSCGFMYICTNGTNGDVASDCSGNGRFSRQLYQSSCANGGQILLYRMEEQTTYFLRVQAGATADFAFIANEFACICASEFSNCDQVTARPENAAQNGDTYSCQINSAFNGTHQFLYWEVNGQQQQRGNSSAILTANQEGNTLVCATYLCNNREYKCCQEVICPPASNAAASNCPGINRWSDVLRQPWFVGTPNAVGALTERYCQQSIQFDIRSNGSSNVIAIILGTGTTEYFSCDGTLLASCSTGACNPATFNASQYATVVSSSQQDNARPTQGPACLQSPPPPSNANTSCTEEDFDNYSNSVRIAEQSDQWITWRDGFEGAEPDAYLFKGPTSDDGFLYVLDENPNGNGAHDVVYILGENRTGVHHVSMRIFVSNGYSAYFNIQPSHRRLQGGGIWKLVFDSSGQATISVGDQANGTFAYPFNQWVDVMMQFDLDNRTITSFVLQNGTVLHNQTINYNEQFFLGGINYYAYEGARFWVDNINFDCTENANFFAANANVSRSNRPSKASLEDTRKPDRLKTSYTGSKEKKPVPNLSPQGAPGSSTNLNLQNKKKRIQPTQRNNRRGNINRSQQKIKN